MSKKVMSFAKHRNNGFVVDLVRDGLGFSVESIDKVVSKDWERVKKEECVASEHYKEILDKVCEAIVKELFSLDDGQENEVDFQEIEFFNKLVKEILHYYSQYKSYVGTLGASQKQVRFFSYKCLFYPIFSSCHFCDRLDKVGIATK